MSSKSMAPVLERAPAPREAKRDEAREAKAANAEAGAEPAAEHGDAEAHTQLQHKRKPSYSEFRLSAELSAAAVQMGESISGANFLTGREESEPWPQDLRDAGLSPSPRRASRVSVSRRSSARSGRQTPPRSPRQPATPLHAGSISGDLAAHGKPKACCALV